MAKLEIPIRVYMGEIEEIINELKHLQTYKLFEGDDEVLINRDDVIKIFANHLHTETLSGSTIEPERKKEKWIPVSERMPNQNERFLVQYEDGQMDVARCSDVNPFWTNLKTDWHWVGTVQFAEVVAWMPLPELWKGEGDE